MGLVRLTPVAPFTITSYAFGLTEIKMRDYFLGTFGSLPTMFTYVYAGTVTDSVYHSFWVTGASRSPQPGFLILGLISIGILVFLLHICSGTHSVRLMAKSPIRVHEIIYQCGWYNANELVEDG